jgi:hypothetical protein
MLKTEKEIIEEFKKCKADPIYFICNYVKVIHPIKGLMKFELYPFQKDIINDYLTHKSVITNKFRQGGVTTTTAAFLLWFTLFNAHKTVVILSKDDDASKLVVSMVRTMHEELPVWLRPKLKKDAEHTLRFENNSVIRSKASSKQTGRSIAASILFVDESAFVPDFETIFTAASPILSTGGKIFVVSTPNGVGNLFHKLVTEAIDKTNGFHYRFLDFHTHPEYSIVEGYEHLYIPNWEHDNRKKYSFRQWNQEYCGQFIGTGDTYMDPEMLVSLKENANKDYYIKYNNRMRVWKDPQPRHDYCLGADPSIGRSHDYSAFHIIDLYNGEQVAEFYSNRTPLNEFAKIIVDEEDTIIQLMCCLKRI